MSLSHSLFMAEVEALAAERARITLPPRTAAEVQALRWGTDAVLKDQGAFQTAAKRAIDRQIHGE